MQPGFISRGIFDSFDRRVCQLVSAVHRRVIFTEQFYFPEGGGGAQIPRDITMHLARKGFDVEVICGSDQYAPVEGDPGEDPAAVGVNIRRIPRLLGGDVHRNKLLRQLWFCFAALPLLLFRPAPGLFVTQTNPPLIVPLIACVAAVRRRPFVIIAQDLYPEVLIAHGMVGSNSLAARMLRLVFGWAYRRAARVVSLGPVMSQRLIEKGVAAERITVICNWATGDERIVRGSSNRLRAEWGLEDCFVVLYSGNLGIAHDVETPILALRGLLGEVPTLRLVFIGKGPRLAEAQRIARDAGVSAAVQFRPLVPFDMLPHSMGIADVALVTLRKGFEGLVVPSKLLGYMARGVPTLYVGPPSDAQRLIEESAGGLSVSNGDVPGLVEILRRLAAGPDTLSQMSKSAEGFYHRRVARQFSLAHYQSVFEQVGHYAST
jgi:glycosyltransferase involved in cell wall biosynthesis